MPQTATRRRELLFQVRELTDQLIVLNEEAAELERTMLERDLTDEEIISSVDKILAAGGPWGWEAIDRRHANFAGNGHLNLPFSFDTIVDRLGNVLMSHADGDERVDFKHAVDRDRAIATGRIPGPGDVPLEDLDLPDTIDRLYWQSGDFVNFQMPKARNPSGAVTYRLTGPRTLPRSVEYNNDPDNPRLVGRVNETMPATEFKWIAMDAAGREAEISFEIEVSRTSPDVLEFTPSGVTGAIPGTRYTTESNVLAGTGGPWGIDIGLNQMATVEQINEIVDLRIDGTKTTFERGITSIRAGQRIQLSVLPHPARGVQRIVTVHVGSLPAQFTLDSSNRDTAPSGFAFADSEGRAGDDVYSQPVRIRGVNVAIDVVALTSGLTILHSSTNDPPAEISSGRVSANEGDLIQLKATASLRTQTFEVQGGSVVAEWRVSGTAIPPASCLQFANADGQIISEEYITEAKTQGTLNEVTRLTITETVFTTGSPPGSARTSQAKLLKTVGGRTTEATSNVVAEGEVLSIKTNTAPNYGQTLRVTLTYTGASGTTTSCFFDVVNKAIGDSYPDPISFGPDITREIGETGRSRTHVISGLDKGAAAVIRLLSGTMYVLAPNGTVATHSTANADILVEEGTQLQLEAPARNNAGDTAASITYQASAGNPVTVTFTVTWTPPPPPRDCDPDDPPTAFGTIPLQEPGVEYTSAPWTIKGINEACPIWIDTTLANPKLLIDGVEIDPVPTSKSADVTISVNQTIVVKATTPGLGQEVPLTIHVDLYSTVLNIGTREAKTTPTLTPDQFRVLTPVSRGSTQRTLFHLISNIEVPLTITYTNRGTGTGEGAAKIYKLDGTLIPSGGTVRNGDSFAVELKASNKYSTPQSTTVRIGQNFERTFTVNTVDDATTNAPEDFTLGDPRTGLTRNTFYYQEVQIVFDPDDDIAPMSITAVEDNVALNIQDYGVAIKPAGSSTFAVPSNNSWRTATNTDSSINISHGDTIRVALKTGDYSSTRTLTLNIGGVSSTFTLTAEAAPVATGLPMWTTPITRTGRNPGATETIGPYEIVGLGDGNTANLSATGAGSPSITRTRPGADPLTFTSGTQTVQDGDTVTMSVTADSRPNRRIRAFLTIGNRIITLIVITGRGTVETVAIHHGVFSSVAPGLATFSDSGTFKSNVAFEFDLSGTTVLQANTEWLVLAISNGWHPASCHINFGKVGQRDLFSPDTVVPYIVNGQLDGWAIPLPPGALGPMRVTVAAAQRTPNDIVLQNAPGLAPSTDDQTRYHKSNKVTFGGFTNPIAVTTTSGTIIRVDSGGTETDTGLSSITVVAGDQIRIRAAVPKSGSLTITVNYGDTKKATYMLTVTAAVGPTPDVTPATFTFLDALTVNADYASSNIITVAGINQAIPYTFVATMTGASPVVAVLTAKKNGASAWTRPEGVAQDANIFIRGASAAAIFGGIGQQNRISGGGNVSVGDTLQFRVGAPSGSGRVSRLAPNQVNGVTVNLVLTLGEGQNAVSDTWTVRW